MKVRNNPIPAEKDIFRLSGIAFANQLLIFNKVKSVNKTPPIKIAPNAVCQLKPSTLTTV